MRDNLDLETLVQRGEAYRNRVRRRRIRRLTIFLVLIVLGVWLWFGTQPVGALFRYANGIWQQVEVPSQATPLDVQVADDGTVWISTLVYGGLMRYQNGTWSEYDDRDFGTETSFFWGGFTVNEGNFWGATRDAVVHYDGAHWSAYPEALTGDDPTGIAATESDVWLADELGYLAHFDGQQWDTYAPEEVLPGFHRGSKYYSPTLQQTPDGVIWLAYYGIWRYSDGAWSLAHEIDPKDAPFYRIIGAWENTLWFAIGGQIGEYKIPTHKWLRVFAWDEIGLPDEFHYFNITRQGSDLLLATSDGLYRHHDEGWWKEDIPGLNPDYYVGGVTSASEDVLWVAAFSPDMLDDLTQTLFVTKELGLSIVKLLLLFAIIGPPTLRPFRRKKQDAKVDEQLLEVLPELGTPSPKTDSIASLSTSSAILLIASVAAYLANLPVWVLTILLLLFSIWATVRLLLLPTLRQLRSHDLDKTERSRLQRNLRFLIIITAIILTAIFVPAVIVVATGATDIIDAIFPIFIGIALIFGSMHFIQLIVVFRIINGLLAAGQYEQTIALSEPENKWLILINLNVLKQLALVLAGRNEEAEALSMMMLRADPRHAPSLAINLAEAVESQGRYEEALHLLEYAIQSLPQSAAGYRELARHYQVRNAYPERALELTDCMLRFAHKPRFALLDARAGWGVTLGIRALALANVGRHEEAEAVLSRAFEETSPKFKPWLATLHNLAAKVKLAQEDQASAREHFHQAATLDPAGAAGKQAQATLQVMENAK